MTYRVAFQIDPISKLNIKGDTSFALALEAQARNYEIFTYQPPSLFAVEGKIYAHMQKTNFRDSEDAPASLAPPQPCALNEFDVILMRQDPPFNMNYITATYFLEIASQHAVVVNHPAAVRDAPEKILPVRFAHLMPPTMISASLDDISAFRAQHKDIVLKPLYGHGGRGVIRVKEHDGNYPASAEMMLEAYRQPIIAQQFLKEVQAGDKRIILIDGEPAAALNRVPAQGEIRANLIAGASAALAELSAEDKKICAALSDHLKKNGILFAGIDVIAGRLTEINITSPTGMRQIKALGGPDCASLFWDAVERKLTA